MKKQDFTPTTYQEWYELLPEDIRVKAIRNHNNADFGIPFVPMNEAPNEGLFGFSNSMRTAISSAFSWHISPEGQEFWSEIANDPQYIR